FLKEAVVLVVIGAAAGIAGVLAAGRVVSSMLYGGITAADPVSIAAGATALLAVAFGGRLFSSPRAPPGGPPVRLPRRSGLHVLSSAICFTQPLKLPSELPSVHGMFECLDPVDEHDGNIELIALSECRIFVDVDFFNREIPAS